MSDKTLEMIKMYEILPEEEQDLAQEFLKRLVLAWDNDYTKSTKAEIMQMYEAEKEYMNGEVVEYDNIAW